MNSIRIYRAAQTFFRKVGTTSKFYAPEGWHKGQFHVEDPQISAIKTTWHLEFVHPWCIAVAVNVTWLSGVLQGKGKVAPVHTLMAYRKGRWIAYTQSPCVDSSWNVMTHDEWERKWRGNWRMEWVASTVHATMERGVSSITTADAHTSAVSSRLNQLDSSVSPKDETLFLRRWNFLWDMGGVHWIHTQSSPFVYLCLFVFEM